MRWFLILVIVFGNFSSAAKSYQQKDPDLYKYLSFRQSHKIKCLYGVKSVLFNSSGTKLYAFNLEAMSIHEFDRSSKTITRRIQFKPTRSAGWDYVRKRPILSFAEKPVEACFTNRDKILWVSLHNSGGIVPLILDSLNYKSSVYEGPYKVAQVYSSQSKTVETLKLPLVKTGNIPKVIAKTADDNFLLVSNWQSKNISVLQLNDTLAPYARKIKTIHVSSIPRGIAIDDNSNKSFIAIMGGSNVTVIDNNQWKLERKILVPKNPRHIITDKNGRLFISFNSLSQIACVDEKSGKVLFKANTKLQPRTIAISKNRQYLFVTCYAGDAVEVFKINPKSFSKVFTFKNSGKPVGIALYENHENIEAWVCNYTLGYINVYEFKKVY